MLIGLDSALWCSYGADGVRNCFGKFYCINLGFVVLQWTGVCVCMYVCVCVCMYVCLCVCMCVCVCMYVCMYVCVMYVCTYV